MAKLTAYKFEVGSWTASINPSLGLNCYQPLLRKQSGLKCRHTWLSIINYIHSAVLSTTAGNQLICAGSLTWCQRVWRPGNVQEVGALNHQAEGQLPDHHGASGPSFCDVSHTTAACWLLFGLISIFNQQEESVREITLIYGSAKNKSVHEKRNEIEESKKMSEVKRANRELSSFFISHSYTWIIWQQHSPLEWGNWSV